MMFFFFYRRLEVLEIEKLSWNESVHSFRVITKQKSEVLPLELYFVCGEAAQ